MVVGLKQPGKVAVQSLDRGIRGLLSLPKIKSDQQ